MIQMARERSSSLILVAALLVLGATPAVAATTTVTKDVPATYRHLSAERTADNGTKVCVHATFAEWTHVPNAISAHIKYRWRSGFAAANGGPFTDREHTTARDNKDQDYRFDNMWPGDKLLQAEPGVDWSHFGNWVTAGTARCAETFANLQRMVEGTPQVQLTLLVSSPRITALRGTQLLPTKTRRATIGTVTCPAYGECSVVVPKHVKVKIGGKKGKTYALPVEAPKTLKAGQEAATGDVTVTFPKAAVAVLKGTRVRPSVKVTLSNHGTLSTVSSVKRWVRG